MIDNDSLREFARRNWGIAEQDGTSFLACRQATAGDALLRAHLLWQHMKAVRPEWPETASRAADLEHHIQFKALIDRANRASDRS